jgi:hypothetical protein
LGRRANQAGSPRGDAGGIEQGVLVADPDHRIAALPQPTLAFRITRDDRWMLVYAAIDLDDQPGAVAVEIDNIGSERRLPAEVRAVQVEFSQSAPEFFLGRGGVRPQTRREAFATLSGGDGSTAPQARSYIQAWL